ncbi:MAG: putative metallo-hydrolase YycJ [Candidatus Anoxychlamydiales bacterium]|nr:putative metallo-hydrolase YycJ [Candidatus Anoxychlamydiales bacterium]
MIEICPLSSGSKGNSVFFKTKKAKVLIDLGISYLQLKKRLQEINVNPDEIDAVFVTHEHMDHISGLKLFIENHNSLIICNVDVAKAIRNQLNIEENFKIFSTHSSFEFKDMKIFPFSIMHDTIDPVGYIFNVDNLKFAFCTDIGFVSSLVKKYLTDCNYLYLEANHSINMVHSCNRSKIYKDRVLSRVGHLSNDDFFKLLSEIYNDKLKHIHIAHISQNCNSYDLLKDLMEDFLKDKKYKAPFSFTHQDKVSNKVLFKR